MKTPTKRALNIELNTLLDTYAARQTFWYNFCKEADATLLKAKIACIKRAIELKAAGNTDLAADYHRAATMTNCLPIDGQQVFITRLFKEG